MSPSYVTMQHMLTSGKCNQWRKSEPFFPLSITFLTLLPVAMWLVSGEESFSEKRNTRKRATYKREYKRKKGEKCSFLFDFAICTYLDKRERSNSMCYFSNKLKQENQSICSLRDKKRVSLIPRLYLRLKFSSSDHPSPRQDTEPLRGKVE